MVGLPDGEKNFEDIYNRLDSIPACDRRTDGQIDILPRHSPRYAYASRGKNCIHCGQLIHRKISKIGATRCQILRLKCSAPDPVGGA